MNPLEQEYLDNVERAKARDRRRELVISWLTSGIIPMSEVAIEQSIDGRTRKWVRIVLVTVAVLSTLLVIVLPVGTPRQRENAYIRLFVLAFAGLIIATKFVYGRWRRWHDMRLARAWERRLGLDEVSK